MAGPRVGSALPARHSEQKTTRLKGGCTSTPNSPGNRTPPPTQTFSKHSAQKLPTTKSQNYSLTKRNRCRLRNDRNFTSRKRKGGCRSRKMFDMLNTRSTRRVFKGNGRVRTVPGDRGQVVNIQRNRNRSRIGR